MMTNHDQNACRAQAGAARRRVQRETSAFEVPGETATVWGFRFAFTVVYDPTSLVMVKAK